ncbi:hypothetical protein V6Z11_A02G137700 [Gossypium hirsutum]
MRSSEVCGLQGLILHEGLLLRSSRIWLVVKVQL